MDDTLMIYIDEETLSRPEIEAGDDCPEEYISDED